MRQAFAATVFGVALACLVPAMQGAAAQGAPAQDVMLNVGGIQRGYLIHVPASVARPAPLVLVFHGGGGRAEGIARTSGMSELADRENFIVVYPEGEAGASRRGGTWNTGGMDSPSSADDVGFVRALLRDVERKYPIDTRRIYATGESVGGVFAYRLACEMSDTFAAIAPVAATMVEPGCRPRSSVAVLHIHGTADQNIPLAGGAGSMTATGRSWPSPQRSVEAWTKIDGCAKPPSTIAEGPETTCQVYNACRATVELCLVSGGGHAWPGSAPLRWQQRYNVYVSQNFPASERIWAFFAANAKH